MALEYSTTGLADQALLDKIDKLFACNVGEYVSLPQLVVVGDQSSGKSSVLEGLTDLPFPRDNGLCTRFATQITFRRHKSTSIVASIIPDTASSDEHVKKAQEWKREDLQLLTKEAFAAIMVEVHEVMEIASPKKGVVNGKQTFSKDVLKLEIRGPEQEHFSVIDVPGIFSRTTEGVTTKQDIEIVRNMVFGYMKNERSVILAVIPANVDIATQEILERAEEVDPRGRRTLGVLTKPDLVDKGAEPAVMDLLEGKKHKLTLGWHLVRNLGQSEMGDATRSRNEAESAFFDSSSPWNGVDKERVGIATLKIRLKEVLTEMVCHEFPKVKSEISKRLANCKQSLDALGLSRESLSDQRMFLLNISTEFQRITSCALGARYGELNIFEKNPMLKLATLVVSRNEKFSNDLWLFGHSVQFLEGEGANPDDIQEASQLMAGAVGPGKDEGSTRGHKNGGEKATFATGSSYMLKPMVRCKRNISDLDDFMHQPSEFVTASNTNTIPWIKDIYLNSRGFELGSSGSSIFLILWREQSANWANFARGYISDIVSIVHDFILESLRAICRDNKLRDRLIAELRDDLNKRYQKAIDHVDFLLQVEQGTPNTMNHYFNDNLEKCRQGRFKALMKKWAIPGSGFGQNEVVPLKTLINAAPMSNASHTVLDIHDILKAYYKVARKRFVDNVCMQAAEFHLVTGGDTPLQVFSPAFVNRLSDVQLESIAGENSMTQRRRKQLAKEMKDLEAGRKILM